MRRMGILGALVLGCGPVIGVPGEEESGGTTGPGGPMSSPPTSAGSDSSVPPSTVPATTAGTTVPSTSASTTATSGTETVGDTGDPCGDFIGCPELPPGNECGLFDQDCPAGEKCMPWANDGGNVWNATKCSPIAAFPVGVGDPCLVEGSAVSGVDNCDGSSMCFWVDTDTNQGRCAAFCTGSENNPMCGDACETCSITGDGVLTICIPSCDPLAQDCDPGLGCYPWNDRFGCFEDASEGAGEPGEECEFINVCRAGNLCIQAAELADCEGSGCCTPVCTVGDDAGCAALPGTVCRSLFEDDPPDACIPAAAGFCGVPE